jgi:hypothetical protein
LTKKFYACVFAATEKGRRVQKSPPGAGVEVKMFNPYLGWMDAETRARERKFLRRLAFVFVMGTFVLPLLGGMVFLAATACRLML